MFSVFVLEMHAQSVSILRVSEEIEYIRFESRDEEFTFTFDRDQQEEPALIELPADQYIVYANNGSQEAQVATPNGKTMTVDDGVWYLLDISGSMGMGIRLQKHEYGNLGSPSESEDIFFWTFDSAIGAYALIDEIIPEDQLNEDNANSFIQAHVQAPIQPLQAGEYYLAQGLVQGMMKYVTDDWGDPIEFDMTEPGKLYSVSDSEISAQPLSWKFSDEHQSSP